MFMISSGKYVQKDMGAIVTQQIINQTARSLAGAFLGPPIRTYCTMSGFPHLRHTSWGGDVGGEIPTQSLLDIKSAKDKNLHALSLYFGFGETQNPFMLGLHVVTISRIESAYISYL